MPKKKLTDRTLQALRPAETGKRYTVWDTETPALSVRVTDKGTRTFVVMRRRPGHKNPDRVRLGTYPDMSLKEARERADEARKDLKLGVLPREREEQRRREETRKRKDTFASVAEEFIKRHVVGPNPNKPRMRTANQAEKAIRRDLIPRWEKCPITSITRRNVIELLEEIMDRGDGKRRGQVSYAAHHALAYTRKLFNWAIARDVYGLESSPCDRVSARDIIGAKEKRKRVLTDDEIRLLWQATEWTIDPAEPGGGGKAQALGYPLAPLVRMLLITGQRLNEVARAERREVDAGGALWTIPAERMKGGIAHEVPLSELALKLLGSLPKFQGGTFLFSTTCGKKPVSGFSKLKARLDKAIVKARRRALRVPEDDGELRAALGLVAGEAIPEEYRVEPWSFHDLRRTMRTRLSALSIPDEVRELMIAHSKPELHQIYDQHTFRDEKRQGFALWADRLLAIAEPPLAGEVVQPAGPPVDAVIVDDSGISDFAEASRAE